MFSLVHVIFLLISRFFENRSLSLVQFNGYFFAVGVIRFMNFNDFPIWSVVLIRIGEDFGFPKFYAMVCLCLNI